MKSVMFCFLTGYGGFVYSLWFSSHRVSFSLPYGSHQKGNSYGLLPIKLADLICFRFLSLTSSAQILAGNENNDYILAMKEENQFTVKDPLDELDSSQMKAPILIGLKYQDKC